MNRLPVIAQGPARLGATLKGPDEVVVGHGQGLSRSLDCMSSTLSQAIVNVRDMTTRDPSYTLAGRIRIGMVQAGITNPTELARKMKANRQTVHRWVNGEGDKITPRLLFRMADILKVNPRWLALGEGSPTMPTDPSLEESEALALFRALPEAGKQAWLSQGRDLGRLLAPVSSNNPFPHRRKT